MRNPETTTLRPGQKHDKLKLAEVLSHHLLTGEGQYPYDSLRAITVSYLNKDWRGAWDDNDVTDVLSLFWINGRKYHKPGKGNPINFLIKVAHTTMCNKFKTRRRNVVTVEPDHPEWVAAACDYELPDLDLPTREELEEGIGELFHRRATMARLRYLSGLSDGEIARIMGIEKSAVSSKLSFVKSQLGTIMRNKIGDRK